MRELSAELTERVTRQDLQQTVTQQVRQLLLMIRFYMIIQWCIVFTGIGEASGRSFVVIRASGSDSTK